jgi:hypothetical protein
LRRKHPWPAGSTDANVGTKLRVSDGERYRYRLLTQPSFPSVRKALVLAFARAEPRQQTVLEHACFDQPCLCLRSRAAAAESGRHASIIMKSERDVIGAEIGPYLIQAKLGEGGMTRCSARLIPFLGLRWRKKSHIPIVDRKFAYKLRARASGPCRCRPMPALRQH